MAIERLSVDFTLHDGLVEAVREVSLEVAPGECLGVVGESGSGKSQTFMAVMGLLPANSHARGSVRFGGEELLGLNVPAINRWRGSRMTMVFQDPLSALTPHMRIGDQIAEPLRRHLKLPAGEARERAAHWLERVRIPEPGRRMRQYPHELSGGMRQRVMIAMAMACGPELLIADEPTTALDATVQAEILDLMAELRDQSGAAMVLITHDMGVIARQADRVCVMQAGRVVEAGPVGALFGAPKTAYAQGLLAAVPRLDRPGRAGRPETAPVAADAEAVVEARDIVVEFPIAQGLFAPRRDFRAVDRVSLRVRRGETLGVVGESGSGKSSLARAILRLSPHAQGAVAVLGRALDLADQKAIRAARRNMQVVFQDPLASLDPRMTIGVSIAEPLRAFQPELTRAQRDAACRAMMVQAGLDPDLINRYPHELSGGQNQRVGIARAMILKPRLVICDEAVSALDVTIRAQIIDLLITLQRDMGLAMIFISHDLAVVREMSHRVMVLCRGRVMETAGRDELFAAPRHPYTRRLLSAALTPEPALERARQPVAGAPIDFPEGADLVEIAPNHFVSMIAPEQA